MEGEEPDGESDPESGGLKLSGYNWLRERRGKRGVEVRGDVDEEIDEVEEARNESSKEANEAKSPCVVAAGEHGEKKSEDSDDELEKEKENVEATGKTLVAVFTQVSEVVEDDLVEEKGCAGREESHNGCNFKILKTRFH